MAAVFYIKQRYLGVVTVGISVVFPLQFEITKGPMSWDSTVIDFLIYLETISCWILLF